MILIDDAAIVTTCPCDNYHKMIVLKLPVDHVAHASKIGENIKIILL